MTTIKFQLKVLCCYVLIMLFSANLYSAGNKNEKITSKWKIFFNEKQGFEFKYPEDYTIVSRQPEEFNIKGLEQVLDLMKGQQFILRILTKRTDETYENHFKFVRRVSKSCREILINDVPAIQYINCGSAACSWYIDFIKDKKEINIVPFVDGNSEGPTDKKYPLRSIVYSLRFKRTTKE